MHAWQWCSLPIQKQYIESANLKVMITSKVALNLSEKRLIYTEVKENIKIGNILQFWNVVTCTLWNGRSLTLKSKEVDKSTCFNSTIVEIIIKHHLTWICTCSGEVHGVFVKIERGTQKIKKKKKQEKCLWFYWIFYCGLRFRSVGHKLANATTMCR